jgi:glycosyltransferase involved in cell wall biosynthesis
VRTAPPVRLALLAASPVYFQAPLYRRLAADPRLHFTAVFASTSGVRPGNFGYGRPVAFDADALSGYPHVFLRRADRNEAESSRLLTELHDWDVVPTLRQLDPEVLWLHGYTSITHILAATLQRLLRRPVLLRDDQTLLNGRPSWKRASKRALFATVFRNATALPVGTENSRWFAAHGFDERRFAFVPNCVDNDALSASATRLAPRRAELRRSFGIADDGAPVVLSVGRLIPEKHPRVLLDAFTRVRRERRCTLLLVGSGPLEAELRSEIDRRHIPDVVLAGFLNQTEIASAYAAADVFVLPSASETWGVTVNEAMNFGLPVVVSDKVGCAADLVRDGATGFVTAAGEPEDLADRLAVLVDDRDLRSRLGTAARTHIATWSYEVAAAGIVEAVSCAVGSERWHAAGQPAVLTSIVGAST